MYCLRFCCHILKTYNTANGLFKACLCHKADIYIFTATINNLNKHVVDILVMKKWGMNYLVIQ